MQFPWPLPRLNVGTFETLAAALVVLLNSLSFQPAWADAEAQPAAAPPAIRLNTVGYLPQSPKLATVADMEGEFVILDVHTGEEVFRGPLVQIEKHAAEGEPLSVADFSALQRGGTYRMQLPSRATSSSFRIATDVFNWPFHCVTRGMYLWRCGTAVEGQFAGDTFHHAACHLDDAYLDKVGGPRGKRKHGVGGWHDAGDYNKYTVNGAFTAGMMLKAWEHFRENLASLELELPESGDAVPDFLDEVRWELEWLMTMQADDGSVYHKLSTLKFGDFVPPEEEKARRYFSPWGSAATADFVAVMAQASRVLRPFDKAFSQRCLVAAKKSYLFLAQHPHDHRPDQSAFSTGLYDAPDGDDRQWAAAELWETTGDAAYLRDFEARVADLSAGAPQASSIVDVDWDWNNVRNLGLFTYLLSDRAGRNADTVKRLRAGAIAAADSIAKAAQRHPYGRTLGAKYYWGCNGTVARQAMNLEVARRLTGEPQYRAAMLHALNHLFGRNPFGRSYVTGLGERPPRFPHDRRSGGDDVAAPWPGYLVGGPWPKPTDWYDVQEDYRTNETAINWNGAMIYALAAFVEPKVYDASIAAAKMANPTPGEEQP